MSIIEILSSWPDLLFGARISQIDKAIRKEQAGRLPESGDKRLQKFLNRNVGRTLQLIVEKNGFGRAENFAPVAFDHETNPGALVFVKTRGLTFISRG